MVGLNFSSATYTERRRHWKNTSCFPATSCITLKTTTNNCVAKKDYVLHSVCAVNLHLPQIDFLPWMLQICLRPTRQKLERWAKYEACNLFLISLQFGIKLVFAVREYGRFFHFRANKLLFWRAYSFRVHNTTRIRRRSRKKLMFF